MAAVLYRKPPSKEDRATMQLFQLTDQDFAAERTAEVWPDNVTAVNAFVALSTQWRVGPGGAYGLDYTAIPGVLRILGVPRAQWREVFDDLRHLEDAALETMREG